MIFVINNPHENLTIEIQLLFLWVLNVGIVTPNNGFNYIFRLSIYLINFMISLESQN